MFVYIQLNTSRFNIEKESFFFRIFEKFVERANNKISVQLGVLNEHDIETICVVAVVNITYV